jgi:putative ABC transport system permease protein
VTAASGLPNVAWNGEWGQINWEGKNPDQTLRMNHIAVDDNFIKTLNMEMAYGRDFSRKFSTDTSNFILNEAAIKAMGIEEPIGKQFTLLFRTGTIVGVVKDFHYASLRNTIDPLILRMVPSRFWRFVIVKIKPGARDLTDLLSFIKSKYSTYAPAYPFEFTFMDERIDLQYRTEQRTGTILICFSILTIFVACLGLLGLVSFMAEKRTKEIGIRKVLGASIPAVVLLLIKEFVKWVLVANLIAWPVAYFLMKQMLQNNYSYRIPIGVDILIIAGLFSIIISLFTVSYQALKAARTNPVDSLKYE